MNRAWLSLGLMGMGLIVSVDLSSAQTVVPDGSLNTIVNTSNNRDFTITNGAAAGSNLFHSFREFSIPTGGSATFDLVNTHNISTIFSRVTGSNVSSIDGLIKTSNSISPVSLFLLNPNGILFGTNARLDIGGSFIGTTATSVKFADGTEFAANSSTAPLLTMSVPIGLQMGQNPSAISVNGTGHTLQLPGTYAPVIRTSPPTSGLQVKPNRTLALVGGNVTLDGGVLSAPQGRLEIISGSSGSVSLIPVAQGWDLNADSLQADRDILLTNRSSIEASGAGNTALQLVGKTIQIRNGSIALMVTQGSQPPGSFQIKASEAFQLSGLDRSGRLGSFVINDVFAGTGADMLIVAPQIRLLDAAMVHARAFGRSQAGNVAIKASSIQLDGQFDTNSTIRTRLAASTLGQSNAGILTISADQLLVLNSAIISSSNLGSGRGGDMIMVANTVKVDGFSPLTQQPALVTVSALGVGNAGKLSINTQELSVTRGGNINTSTLASGNAGSLEITATRSIEVSGGVPSLSGEVEVSRIASAANVVSRETQQNLGLPPIPSGAAGSLTLNTPSLSILNGATVRVSNLGSGNAGTLNINANSIYLNGGSMIEAVTAVGDGGNLSLTAQTLLLRDRASITATAGGAGNGGNITIQSPIVLGLGNSDIVANADRGQGGNIAITTQGIFGLQNRDRLTPASDITASSKFGINGTVQVNNVGVDPNAGLVELSNTLIDQTQQLTAGCSSNQGSSFVMTGRGGIPMNPLDQTAGRHRTWTDLRSLSLSNQPVRAESTLPLVEATAWKRDLNGRVQLIAESPIPSTQTATCAGGDR
ncbi:two-partner secretion domain-containing protein [Leptolyngbya sp. NIES-2104]|uniref:two-partner secretion domain-containing protein n=1 Tax=Leptolyngbya sp. NIES-2104 TaxID=1552121 RepID=UPI0006EC6B60|nr:filamentous hemagglutinin N-terminal domain-containing protein [Leptolyngbya sp. NIES-2104]GAP99299.1 putative hemagglutinin-related protein [Leptolyngbya sp. NIES-2104]